MKPSLPSLRNVTIMYINMKVFGPCVFVLSLIVDTYNWMVYHIWQDLSLWTSTHYDGMMCLFLWIESKEYNGEYKHNFTQHHGVPLLMSRILRISRGVYLSYVGHLCKVNSIQQKYYSLHKGKPPVEPFPSLAIQNNNNNNKMNYKKISSQLSCHAHLSHEVGTWCVVCIFMIQFRVGMS